jgi:hypothetical protein
VCVTQALRFKIKTGAADYTSEPLGQGGSAFDPPLRPGPGACGPWRGSVRCACATAFSGLAALRLLTALPSLRLLRRLPGTSVPAAWAREWVFNFAPTFCLSSVNAEPLSRFQYHAVWRLAPLSSWWGGDGPGMAVRLLPLASRVAGPRGDWPGHQLPQGRTSMW